MAGKLATLVKKNTWDWFFLGKLLFAAFGFIKSERLIAQLGNMKPIWLQENDIDCEKAFALVAKATSIGTLVAI